MLNKLKILLTLMLFATVLFGGSRYINGSGSLAGTVLDADTGLRWLKCSLLNEGNADSSSSCSGTPGSYNWEEALAACEDLDYAGISQWRLPNIKELQSITSMYYDRLPRINQKYFPNTARSIYYSSTSMVGRSNDEPSNTSYAWGIDFRFGNYNPYLKTQNYTAGFSGEEYNHFVRCVTGP